MLIIPEGEYFTKKEYEQLEAKINGLQIQLKEKDMKLSGLNTDYNKLKKSLESQIEDVKIKLSGKTAEVKQLEKKIKDLEHELESLRKKLHSINSLPEIVNPKQMIFKWTDENGKLIVKVVHKKIIDNIDNIQNYIIDITDNGLVEFEDGFYQQDEDCFPIYEAHLNELKKKIKEVIESGKYKSKKYPTLQELMKYDRDKKTITDSMEKVWNVLVESKAKKLLRTVKEIMDMTGLVKQSVYNQINYFIKREWVRKSGIRYELEDFD